MLMEYCLVKTSIQNHIKDHIKDVNHIKDVKVCLKLERDISTLAVFIYEWRSYGLLKCYIFL